MSALTPSIKIFLSVCLFISLIWLVRPSQASAATLIGASDYINNDAVDATNVSHNVGFVIPSNGHALQSSDYIRIILSNFSDVTAPTSGSGWSGSPTYSVNGNVALITGVTSSTNIGIGISGITATNPSDEGLFTATIQIADDADGTTVYDSATVTVQAIQGTSTVSVTIAEPTSSLELHGFTSPGAFVTYTLDGNVAGTSIADGDGNFEKQLTGLTPSTSYLVGMYSVDTEARISQTISFIVNTISGVNLIVSNIVIPTTLSIDQTEIFIGDTLHVEGLAHPLSQVTVFVNGTNNYSDTVQANSAGNWAYTFNTNENPVLPGVHATYGKEVVLGGYTSIFTQSEQFQVFACDTADINCDGEVNLTDFSILLFYWGDTDPGNIRADVNGDSVVNLTDFSVMLYYWSG